MEENLLICRKFIAQENKKREKILLFTKKDVYLCRYFSQLWII